MLRLIFKYLSASETLNPSLTSSANISRCPDILLFFNVSMTMVCFRLFSYYLLEFFDFFSKLLYPGFLTVFPSLLWLFQETYLAICNEGLGNPVFSVDLRKALSSIKPFQNYCHLFFCETFFTINCVSLSLF